MPFIAHHKKPTYLSGFMNVYIGACAFILLESQHATRKQTQTKSDTFLFNSHAIVSVTWVPSVKLRLEIKCCFLSVSGNHSCCLSGTCSVKWLVVIKCVQVPYIVNCNYLGICSLYSKLQHLLNVATCSISKL